uniref:WD_REPEATS_REGION domain-containing protein n=1 Tax=Rodentolepis nana TaxID=102285 RepID=A0A0R3T6S9_RODNA
MFATNAGSHLLRQAWRFIRYFGHPCDVSLCGAPKFSVKRRIVSFNPSGQLIFSATKSGRYLCNRHLNARPSDQVSADKSNIGGQMGSEGESRSWYHLRRLTRGV